MNGGRGRALISQIFTGKRAPSTYSHAELICNEYTYTWEIPFRCDVNNIKFIKINKYIGMDQRAICLVKFLFLELFLVVSVKLV